MHVQAPQRNNRMKLGIRKIFSRLMQMRKKAIPVDESDIDLLTPLTELLKEARPEPGLLSDIETELDGSPVSSTAAQNARWVKNTRAGTFIIVAVLAAMLTSVSTAILQPTQEIIVRQDQSGTWVSLGVVRLSGQALREFVHLKCRGYTHLEIDLKGYNSEEKPDPEAMEPESAAIPLMAKGEKILMGCNF